jgi:hypothetical protein
MNSAEVEYVYIDGVFVPQEEAKNICVGSRSYYMVMGYLKP